MTRPLPFVTPLLAGLALAAYASATPAERVARVDKEGVLRWQDGSEAALFGVNYYPPLHWNYRDIRALGLSHETVIEQDLAHFSRLGLDAPRLHVFDREVSDREGNLTPNEHLRLLDFLIAKAKARGNQKSTTDAQVTWHIDASWQSFAMTKRGGDGEAGGHPQQSPLARSISLTQPPSSHETSPLL